MQFSMNSRKLVEYKEAPQKMDRVTAKQSCFRIGRTYDCHYRLLFDERNKP